ncbi:uncharacterized protein LOC103480574 isoform X1 [Poecilia reticulata]|uniref:uncharacterized protein LOC103480574 isoform X1 n=1 Tax=Poecilia reticulata TaxID=8081 RepID=UPI0007E9C1D0|nr:PREDICTED: POM121 and ZP3 fusion protein isoform X1 [Poecilia reticulata]
MVISARLQDCGTESRMHDGYFTARLDSCLRIKLSDFALASKCFISTKHLQSRWRSIEGDIALCECCNTDCSGLTGVKNHGHPETDETFEAHRTAGRLHVVHQSNWTGELSGFQSVEKTLLQVQSLVLNEPPTIKYSPVRRLRSLMKMFCVGSLAPGCLVPVFPYTLSLAYFLFSY